MRRGVSAALCGVEVPETLVRLVVTLRPDESRTRSLDEVLDSPVKMFRAELNRRENICNSFVLCGYSRAMLRYVGREEAAENNIDA